MRNALLFLWVFSFAFSAGAQAKKRIKTGRRYKSGSQFALTKNDFQAEWEAGREATDPQLTTFVYPNLVLHYALSDRLEVNTEMSLITTKFNSTSLQKNSTGIEPVLIGVNCQVLQDTYNSPSIIVSGQLAFPFLSTKAFATNYPAPVLQVNIQEAVSDKWMFGTSGGLLWDGYSAIPRFTYNASTSHSFQKKWMVTAECFGFIGHDLPQNSFDASLAYVINNLVQFGISAGVGLSSAAPKNYFAVNGSWGFNTSRKRQAPGEARKP